ncbi:MAG: hypothetical protein NTW87_24235 [Planctomycetota bacterium]|nr:hypothetical protein [Planctomycetota bacterium]
MRNVLRSNGSTLRMWIPAIIVSVCVAAPFGVAAVGGGGPDIIPSFVQNVGGGSPGVTITFDPSSTYLPVSPDPAQQYRYQAIWDFGDGTPVVLRPPLAGAGGLALASVQHTYVGGGDFTVTFRIDITVVNLGAAGEAAGPSAFTTGRAHIANVNYPPTPHLLNMSSPATGTLPYELVVNASTSVDEDGFIIWGAIDWGDGTTQLLTAPLPPVIPNTTMNHIYTNPGVYRVTLSLIDNGRMPVGTKPPSGLDSRDPNAALTGIIQAQQKLFITDPILRDSKYDPQLKQEFLLVQVPGNMVVVKGQFQVDFRRPNADKLDVLFRSNVFPDSLANASIVLSLGGGATPFRPGTFTADARGRFQDRALGFMFDFNARKRALRLKISHAALAAALGLANSTAVNANVDVPVSITFNNVAPPFTAKVRFAYNATAGSRGLGKDGRSYPNGN